MGIGWGPAYHLLGSKTFEGCPDIHPLRSSEFWDPFFLDSLGSEDGETMQKTLVLKTGIRFEGRGQICWWCLVAGFRQAGDQSGHRVFQVVK